MLPADLAILLHRALEVRLARLQEGLADPEWAADEERLHQVRVSARRLGAVLDLVDAETYPGLKGRRRALKGLVDTLGLPRELDVHAIFLATRLQSCRDSRQAAVLEHLLERVDRRRAKARRSMLKDLHDLRLPDLGRLLEVPALPHPFQGASLQEAAWVCLEPRTGAALGELEALAAQEDAAALHKVRVRIKKLRYAVEALEGAFAGPPEVLLKGLRAHQTLLGEHHDLATLEALLWSEEEGLRTRGRQTLRGGVLELLGEVAEGRRAAFGRFTLLAREESLEAFTSRARALLGLPTPDGSEA
jgi:CHAD domain-containing protein